MQNLIVPVHRAYDVSYHSSAKRKRSWKWVFVTARLLALAAGLALIIYSFSWATDGLWDIATIIFIAGMIFFIPFILFGRKIRAIKSHRHT